MKAWQFDPSRPAPGLLLTEIEAKDPSYGQLTRALYEHVRNQAQPFDLRGVVPPTVPSRFTSHETIFFPLGKNGAVDHLMATLHLEEKAA